MDGPAVVASPPSGRLCRKNPTDLEDLVLELDDADLNLVDSSPDSNDYKDMKLPESPPSMEISSEKRDGPCEDGILKSPSEKSSLQTTNKDSVEENGLETEVKEEEAAVESTEPSAVEEITPVLPVEVKEEEEDVKPEIKEDPLCIEHTDLPADSIDSIDKELDGLLNTDSENQLENMEVKEEDGDSILFEDELMEDNATKIEADEETDVLFDDTDDEGNCVPSVPLEVPNSNGITPNTDLENASGKADSNEVISSQIAKPNIPPNESLSKDDSMDSMRDDACLDELDDSNTGSEVPGEKSSDPVPHPKSPEPAHVIVNKSKDMPSNKRQAERDFEEITKKMKTNSGEKIVNGLIEPKRHINGFREVELEKIMQKDKVTCGVQTDEAYKVAREQLAAVKSLNERPLTVNGNMLEELVMMKVVEYLTLGEQNEKRLDCAALMKKCRFLENSLHQVQKKSQELTKQVEDAKHIIKKLIEDKVASKKPLLPLRVTRSVGLQVCTVGSVNVISTKQKDLESLRKLTGEAHAAASGNTRLDEEKDDIIYMGETPAAAKEDESNAKKTGEKPVVSSSKSPTSSTPGPNTPKSRTNTATLVRTPAAGTPASKAAVPPVPTTPLPNTPDSSTSRKDSSGKKDTSTPCIDLTDTDDAPPPSKPTKDQQATPKSAGITVKPPSALYTPDKLTGSAKSTPTGNSSNPSKLPKKSSGDATSKKITFGPTVTEPSTPPEHLPKLPATPKYPSDVVVPPKPILRIGKNTSGKSGIMLSWCFENQITPPNIEEYHLFAYQENKGNPGEEKSESCWKKVGSINALPLPMACFLTQFIEGHTYHFIVRAVNKDKRVGEFSLPGSISLQNPQSSTSTSTPASSSSKTN